FRYVEHGYRSAPGVEIRDHAHADQAHVNVGQSDPKQAAPREEHVARVEPGSALPSLVLHRRLTTGHAVGAAADEVAERVAAERVARDEAHVDREDDAADADAELAVLEERAHRVLTQKHDEDQREVERVAVDVLEDEDARLAAIARTRPRAHRTTGRRGAERT